MEWVMYTAAGLISGAPWPMSIPDAIRAAGGRRMLIIAAGSVADEPAAARWFWTASPATVQVWVDQVQTFTTALPPMTISPRWLYVCGETFV